MTLTPSSVSRAAQRATLGLAPLAIALGLSGGALGPPASALARPAYRAFAAAGARQWSVPAMPGYSASLEQCTPAALAIDRSATFTGEMVAIPGTARMGMRIELLQHVHGQPGYRLVVAPGLGVWRGSEAGVKIYRYVKQITNLTAPASYRAVVHFRWLGERGRLLKRAELRTARCVQPLLAAPEPGAGEPGTPETTRTPGAEPAGAQAR